jgi:hypothetical protein
MRSDSAVVAASMLSPVVLERGGMLPIHRCATGHRKRAYIDFGGNPELVHARVAMDTPERAG